MQGLLVVDHGSRRAESNQQLEGLAERIRELRPEQPVAAAHMELAEPTIAQAFDRLVERGATEIQVLLYFLSDGRHVSEDVPALLEEAAASHPGVTWRLGRALGHHPRLPELLLDLAAG